MAGFDRAPQRAARGQQPALADHLIQGARPHAAAAPRTTAIAAKRTDRITVRRLGDAHGAGAAPVPDSACRMKWDCGRRLEVVIVP